MKIIANISAKNWMRVIAFIPLLYFAIFFLTVDRDPAETTPDDISITSFLPGLCLLALLLVSFFVTGFTFIKLIDAGPDRRKRQEIAVAFGLSLLATLFGNYLLFV